MSTKILEQPPGNSTVIAAAAPAPGPSAAKKKLDELSSNIKTLQKQHQQMQASYTMAAYDHAPRPSRPSQPRSWQGQHTNQVDQLQRQVNRLESELRRYQNPRQPDFRSYGRSYRSTEGDPICTYCNRVGHTRDPRLPQNNNQPPPSRRPNDRPPISQLKG